MSKVVVVAVVVVGLVVVCVVVVVVVKGTEAVEVVVDKAVIHAFHKTLSYIISVKAKVKLTLISTPGSTWTPNSSTVKHNAGMGEIA